MKTLSIIALGVVILVVLIISAGYVLHIIDEEMKEIEKKMDKEEL